MQGISNFRHRTYFIIEISRVYKLNTNEGWCIVFCLNRTQYEAMFQWWCEEEVSHDLHYIIGGKGMLFFTDYSLSNIFIALAVLVGLVAVNELTRRSKILSIIFYIGLPIILGIFVWPKTAIRGDGDWFPIVKTMSALIGVIAFMAIRFIPKLIDKKIMLVFPFAILAVNIIEAILRDLEIFNAYNGTEYFSEVEGLMFMGGPWNVMNAIAGVFLILSMTGLVGIKIANTKSKDMVWPDMLWFWIVAYSLWNMAYCYNCISNRAMYAGLLLLIACEISEIFFKRGAWLQHRAQTLALWGMFSITFSNYATSPLFSIVSTNSPVTMFILSLSALISCAGVFAFAVYKIIKTKRNPFKTDLYVDMKAYKKNLEANNLG